MMSLFPPQSDTLPAGKQGSGVRPRKAMRSYSSQREQLHKTRSRTSSTEAAVQRGRSCDIAPGHVTLPRSCDVALGHVTIATRHVTCWDSFPPAESLRRNLSQPPVEEGSRVDRDVPEAGGGQTASVEVRSVILSLTICTCVPLLVWGVECE